MPINKIQRTLIGVLSLLYVLWSGIFIYHSTILAVDGKRYFCLFDDAMISLRYAWNFAHGQGLVWNVGEYVEGYTNLLMTLLMSLVALLVDDKGLTVLAVQIIGVLVVLAVGWFAVQVAELLLPQDKPQGLRFLFKVLVLVCVLFWYPLSYWSIMGMETGLLALLVTASVWAAFRYTSEPQSKWPLLLGVLMGLGFLTRPDAVIFSALVGVYLLVNGWQRLERSKLVKDMLLMGGVAAVFIGGQTAFRWFYYGELLPNTYVLKMTGLPLFERIQNGVGFTYPFIRQHFLILLLAALEIVFGFSKKKTLLFSLAAVSIFYQIWVGGDPWIYWRMMTPAMPLLFVLFVYAVLVIVEVVISLPFYQRYVLRQPIFAPRHGLQVLLSALVAIGLLLSNRQFLMELFMIYPPYTADALNTDSINTVVALNELTSPEASVGVFAAGAVPYYTGQYAYDFLGKMDKYIARRAPESVSYYGMSSVPGHNKFDLQYSIVEQQPTYIENFIRGTQDVTGFVEQHYTKVDYLGVELFLLSDSPYVNWDKVAAAAETAE